MFQTRLAAFLNPRRAGAAGFMLLSLWLGGCDVLGIETPTAIAERREAEGKAVGGACRHAGRAIEDCYALNRKADKAAVFTGWREMNDYMRENNIEVVKPTGGEASAAVQEKAPEKPADKGKVKPAAKS